MVEGDPAEGEIPALRWNVPLLNESRTGITECGRHKRKDGRYKVSGRIAKSEQPRDEHLEVLADHITGGREC